MDATKVVTTVGAIKAFFTEPPVSVGELKKLTSAERHELGQLVAAQMGLTIEDKSTAA